MSDYEISYVIVCDDARREITGKDILIGVYASSILVFALPAQINVAFWMEVIPKKAGKLSMEFRVETPGKNAPPQMKVEAEVGKAGESFGMFTLPIPVAIVNEGELKLFTRQVGSEKWQMIKRIKLIYSPPVS